MNTQAIRDLVATLELDAEVKAKIESYLSPLESSAEVPKETLDKVVELLDLEVETNELLAQAYEKTGQEIDSYLEKVDQTVTDTTE